MLATLNIVGSSTKTYDVFTRYISPNFTTIPKMKPSEYVADCWSKYMASPDQNNSLNGNIFEAIIATVLYREKIQPFYRQAQLTYVPNVRFDVVLNKKNDDRIIVLSLKTSCRERYKQADLEGMALRNVHRTAECYLITRNAAEAKTVKNKIKKQEVMFINDVIVAESPEFDDFIEKLKGFKYKEATSVPVLSEGEMVK